MSITVHFHAAGPQGTGATGGGMDAGGSPLPATADGMTNGMTHVDSPATAIDAGGPPAELVSMVEAAFAERGAGAQSSGNDAGAAPQFF